DLGGGLAVAAGDEEVGVADLHAGGLGGDRRVGRQLGPVAAGEIGLVVGGRVGLEVDDDQLAVALGQGVEVAPHGDRIVALADRRADVDLAANPPRGSQLGEQVGGDDRAGERGDRL